MKRPPLSKPLQQAQARYLHQVGAAIQAHRTAQQLTQQQLATRARLSRSQLIDIEAGRNTSLATIARICFALDIPPQNLGVAAATAPVQ